MAALGVGATVIAVPRALSGIVAVPQVEQAGISRTLPAAPTSKPSTAKMPVWSAPPATTAAPDTRPPSAVTNLRLLANSETTISLAWDASQDNVAVKLYVVKGDGFGSVQTTDTKATVSWPHRSAGVSVQICAFDAAGNQGEWRTLLVSAPLGAATATTADPTTAPPTTTDPVVTTPAPSQPASSDTASAAATSADPSVVQSAAVQDPGTTAPLADPSGTQTI